MNSLYTDGIEALARRSSRGTYQAIENTGHDIQLARPKVVVGGICKVLNEADNAVRP